MAIYSAMRELDRPSAVVLEASTPEDRKYLLEAASKDEIHQVNGTYVQALYQNTVKRNKCNFGDIPKSNGDIKKTKFYQPTVDSLKVLKELFVANEINEPRLRVIETAVKNVENLTPLFEEGFRQKQDYVILLYNTTVMAIVDATSMLIVSYMDYVVGPDQEKYTPTGRFDKGRGDVSVDSLTKFNNLVADGKIPNTIEKSVTNARHNLTGTGVAATALVIMALMSIVPLLRELVFFFNRQKIKLSDYLDTEVQFLEMHELAVKSSKAHTSAEKREILEKQRAVAAKLRRYRDKLKIQNESAEDGMRKDIKDDNALYTLKNIDATTAQNKMDGTGIQFV